jgi:hypothetical protein
MALVLGVVNAVVRPVLKLLSCPLIILTRRRVEGWVRLAGFGEPLSLASGSTRNGRRV